MIVDSHCHAWERWPYIPEVPDYESRGRIEQLLHEMQVNGVDEAVLICANIERNPRDNEYVAAEAQKHPNVHQFPDVDSYWGPTHHAPGAAGRLRSIAERWPVKGFTHYLSREDDGAWLYSEDGLEFFGVAMERRLIASIACNPHHQPAIRRMAERLPSLPVLVHHLGLVKAHEGPPHAGLKQVLESARLPNIFIKVSGFYYGAARDWDFPYSDVQPVVRALYEAYGPHRMCWGSDYPVARFHCTYRQALECFRGYCAFVPEADKRLILGETLHTLLEERVVKG